MASVATVLLAGALFVGGAVGAAAPVDVQVAQTIDAVHKAAQSHAASDLCRLVVAYARDTHCEQALAQLPKFPIDEITTTSLTTHRDGQLIRADVVAEVHRGDDHRQIAETLWLPVDQPTVVVRPGRLVLMSSGLDSDDAATDARPLSAADLARPAQGTAGHARCPAGTPVSATDPAGDVTRQPLGSRHVTSAGSAGLPYDIRRVRARVGRDGSACFTVVFADRVRVGLGLQLSLTQAKEVLDTRRGLTTTSVLLEPGGRTATGAVPVGMTVDVHGATVRIGLRAGAMRRSVSWRLDLLAYAANADEPLLHGQQVTANDEALLKG